MLDRAHWRDAREETLVMGGPGSERRNRREVCMLHHGIVLRIVCRYDLRVMSNVHRAE